MQNSALTNSQSIGKELERLAIDYLRGDKWKKLVQLESSQISKPDSDQYDPLN